MKLQKYILIEIIMMALATGGLILLTGDYIMSLGIIILLVVIEHLIVSRLEAKREREERGTDDEDIS